MALSSSPFPSLLSQETRNASHPLAPVAVPTTVTGVFFPRDLATRAPAQEDVRVTIVLRVLLSAGLPLAVGGCHPSTSRDMTTSDPQPPPSHSAWIEARETALAAPDGWLTLVDLVWLQYPLASSPQFRYRLKMTVHRPIGRDQDIHRMC